MKSLRARLAVLFLAAGSVLGLAAPPVEFMTRSWRNEEGLPHSVINSIVQTRDGYLWIGTYVGLLRFDGKRFVHFASSNSPEKSPWLICKLFEDRSGVLWIALEDGGLLAWKDGVAREHLKGDPASKSAIIAMAQDQHETIWCQTADGRLGRFTTNGVEFVARTAESPIARPSLGLVVDHSGELWVGTSDGLRLWRDGKLVVPPGLESLSGRIPDTFAAARDGSIWMYRDRQLWKLRNGRVVAQFEAPEKIIGYASVVLETMDDSVWLAAGEGGLFRHATNGVWQAVPETGLRGPNRVLYQDREGNLWRGSFGGGLTQIRPRLFVPHALPTVSLDRYAYSVSADAAGNVWEVQDSNSRTLARIAGGSGEPLVISSNGTPRGIRTVLADHAGSLWAGTDKGDLCRLRGDKLDPVLKISATGDYVSALYEDPETNLWVGFTKGAGVGMLPRGDPAKWQTIPGVPFPDVRCITRATNGAMWFGTQYGGALRLENGQWSQFTLRDGLPSNYIRCFHADEDGTLWLGTFHGLCRWRDGKFKAITVQNGLWNNFLSHIAEDDRGNFWISSFGGIFSVSRQDLNDFADGLRQSVNCVGYDRHDGLPNIECPGGFQPAGAKSPDGQLWFPTVDGLVSVDAAHLNRNTLMPPVLVEEVTVDAIPHIIRSDTKTIEIGPGRQRYEFRFTALSLTAPEKVRFRHQLEGLDREWSPASGERTANYTYLPPGNYTFRVQACNNDGLWNEAGAGIPLVIRPFFWQTWLFQGAMALVLVIVIAVAVRAVERWKARARLERVERQHAVERERTRIARDIHDDIGANLTQIVFLSQRADGARHDPQEAERWLRRIPSTARRTIQSLDEIVWAINPTHDSLESLANYLSQFAPEYLALAGVRCLLDVPTVLPTAVLSAEVRHNLVLSTREAVQNIVTHAAATEATIRLELDDRELRVTIADNGRGIAQPPSGNEGNGFNNIRRRLADIGGRAEINSRPGAGTTVVLSVPLAQLHGRVIASNGQPGAKS